MLILVTLVIGGMALNELPTDMFPEITFPVISVVTRYTGAAPEEVEKLVTEPLEEALATVHGITDLTSTSQHGLSMVNLKFEWSTNLDTAANDVREAIQFARRFLPDDVPQSAVVRIDLSKMPIWIGTLRGKRSLPALERLADKLLKPRLSRIDGVAAVSFLSAEEEEVLMEAKNDALERFGFGFNRLLSALLTLNRNIPGGTMTLSGKSMPVRTLGETDRVENLGRIPIAATSDGSIVTLGQLVSIRRGPKKQDVLITRNGETCLAMQIMKQSGKNSVRILAEVNAELERLQRQLPEDVKLERVFDQGEFINQSIDAVRGNFILGGILTLTVLWFFLRKISLLIIIGLAIPLSVIITFIPVYFLKYSLNMMSLGGIALGVGMLVDNAIVTLENIDRHLSMGKTPTKAADDGTNEIFPAIAGSTLTTVIVFVPFLFSEGIAARLFIQMGVTISVSLLASLLLSATLVPMMASRLVSDRAPASRGTRPMRIYRRTIEAVLEHPWKVLAGSAALFVAAVTLVAPRLGWEFIPIADDGMIGSPFKLPIGMSLDESRRTIEPLVSKLSSDPRVLSVFERIGFPEGGEEAGAVHGLADVNEGEFFIRLVPKGQRRISTRTFLDEIRAEVAKIPGLEMNLSQSFEQLFSTEKKAIAIKVLGNDLPTLKEIMKQVMKKIAQVDGIRDVEMDLQGGRPEMQLHINRELAIRAGLTVPSIGEAVRTALQGRKIGVFRTDGDDFYMRLIGDPHLEFDSQSLLDLPLEIAPVSSPLSGTTQAAERGKPALTTLRQMAELVPGFGEEKLYRERQMRCGMVSANYSVRSLGEVMHDVSAKLEQMKLPDGYDIEIAGVYKDLLSAIRQLALVFMLGLLLVYMIMASQFESFVDPFCVLFTVPMALIGMLGSLWMTGQTLNVSSAIGLVILLGIVVNNAIVLIEFVNKRRVEGARVKEALTDAATTRLRPIAMTTLTTVLGLVPLSLALGEGAEVQQPLAISIMGGLSFSTLLTLYVIPCVYLLVNRDPHG